MVQFKLFGKTGGFRQLYAYCSSLIDQYRTDKVAFKDTDVYWADWTVPTQYVTRGPFGGLPFCRIDTTTKPFWTIQPSTAAQKATKIPLTKIDLISRSALEIAYIQSQMYLILQMDGNAPESWQGGVVASVLVETGKITREEIIEAMCWCQSDQDCRSNVHPCPLCGVVRLCHDLVLLEDGRRVCSTHTIVVDQYQRVAGQRAGQTGRSGGGKSVPRWLSILRTRLHQLVKDDTALRQRCAKKITSLTHFDIEEPDWNDMYDGERTFKIATFEQRVQNAVSGRRRIHPLEPSIEAPMPAVKIDSTVFYHHDINIGLTTAFANNMKREWSPAIIAVIRAASERTLRERIGVPRDKSFWQGIHNAFDHIHRLSLLVPYAQKKRLVALSALSERGFERFSQAWKTGTWSEDLPRTIRSSDTLPQFGSKPANIRSFVSGKAENYTIRGEWESKRVEQDLLQAEELRQKRVQMRARSQKWSSETILQIQELVDQIERDSRINPDRLILPRIDGVPWPFRVDHSLTQANTAEMWDWWYYEATERYLRMGDECNFEYITEESPITIFCEIIVQWFLRGGGR